MPLRGIEELLDRWKITRPKQPTLGEIQSLLVDEYRAYTLPVSFMEPDGIEFDNDLRQDLVKAMFTITNPLVLNEISYAADSFNADFTNELGFLESKEERAELFDKVWQELFRDSSTPLEYRIISAQHSSGQRASVLLEEEDGLITGFKLYGIRGQGSRLDRHLLARIGFPKRRPIDPADGSFMRPGDISDELFVQYLKAASEFNII
ncbi:hypothetical protein RQN30_00935 [Arcanobacterium hippocoleae]